MLLVSKIVLCSSLALLCQLSHLVFVIRFHSLLLGILAGNLRLSFRLFLGLFCTCLRINHILLGLSFFLDQLFVNLVYVLLDFLFVLLLLFFDISHSFELVVGQLLLELLLSLFFFDLFDFLSGFLVFLPDLCLLFLHILLSHVGLMVQLVRLPHDLVHLSLLLQVFLFGFLTSLLALFFMLLYHLCHLI